MKAFKSFLFVLMASVMWVACGSSDGDEQPVTPVKDDAIEMQISTFVGSDELDQPVPRLVAEWDGQMLAQVTNPEDDGVLMLQYVNHDEACDGVVLVSEHNVIFMHYNPASGANFPSKALVAGDYDGFSSISSCTIDWSSGDIQFDETYPIGQSTKKRLATRSGNDDIKKHFFTLLDDISMGVDGMDAVLDKMEPAGVSAKTLCAAWTKVAIPLMKYNLYADDEIGRKQYVEDYFQSAIESGILGGVQKFLCKITAVESADVNIAKWMAKATYRIAMSDAELNRKKDELVQKGTQAALRFSQNVNKGAAVINTAHENENTAVQVTVQVTDVGENSITLAGAVKFDDSSYASYVAAGYSYYVGDTERRLKTSVGNDFSIAPGTITNLEPATKYAVAAFYESLTSSKTFYSRYVDVVTKGTVFELSSSSIESAAEGGTANIQVRLGYETSWRVKSKPSWCTCTQQANMLVVEVNENTGEMRTGEIVLEATNYYGEKTTVAIQVEQAAAANEEDDDWGTWEGTAWSFNGTVNMVDSEDGSGSATLNLTFDFSNMKSVAIRFTDGEEEVAMTGQANVSSDGKTVVVKSAGTESGTEYGYRYVDTYDFTFTLQRTGANTAALDFTGSGNYTSTDLETGKTDHDNTTLYGHLDGVRTK